MKLIIILTTALAISACAKGGGSADNSGTAGLQQVLQNGFISGTYMVKSAPTVAGTTYVIFTTFSSGKYEERTYKVTIAGNQASYIRYTSNDNPIGDVQHTSLIYATCSSINGVNTPASDAFPVSSNGDGTITLFSNGANTYFTLSHVASIDQVLSAMGVSVTHEVTDCSQTF